MTGLARSPTAAPLSASRTRLLIFSLPGRRKSVEIERYRAVDGDQHAIVERGAKSNFRPRTMRRIGCRQRICTRCAMRGARVHDRLPRGLETEDPPQMEPNLLDRPDVRLGHRASLSA